MLDNVAAAATPSRYSESNSIPELRRMLRIGYFDPVTRKLNRTYLYEV